MISRLSRLRPLRRLRHLLFVPAMALLVIGVPALALEPGSLPRPTTTSVPFLMPLAGDVGVGWTGDAEVDADLVGVIWNGDPAARFRVDVSRGGDWRFGGEVGVLDDGTDDADPEARSASNGAGFEYASAPLWVGDADAVRITMAEGSANAVTLEAITADEATVPNGSAGALGLSVGSGPDRFGFGIALVLVAAVLVALAFGWAPWRPRRRLLMLSTVGLVTLAACANTLPPPPPSPNPTTPPQPAMTMRSQWGADLAWNPSPDCDHGPETAESLKFAVVHHTVNSNNYGPGDSVAMVRAIWQYHVRTLGFCDIGYNFLVDRYGQTFEGRMGGIDKAVIAAHTGGFNTSSTGAAFLGDFRGAQPTQAAWDAMVNLLAWKFSVHKVNPSAGFTTTSNGGGSRWPAGTVVSFPNALIAHRDVWPTLDPADLYPRMDELRAAVQAKVGWDTSPTTTTVAAP